MKYMSHKQERSATLKIPTVDRWTESTIPELRYIPGMSIAKWSICRFLVEVRLIEQGGLSWSASAWARTKDTKRGKYA